MQRTPGPAIKLGAGVIASQADVAAAAAAAGYGVVTGLCATVGVPGGHSQGGGHSALSNIYDKAATAPADICSVASLVVEAR